MVKSTRSEIYHTVTKSEGIASILYKKLLEKTNTLMHFCSNVNRDGRQGGERHSQQMLAQMSRSIALVFVALELFIFNSNSRHRAYSRLGAYLSDSTFGCQLIQGGLNLKRGLIDSLR